MRGGAVATSLTTTCLYCDFRHVGSPSESRVAHFEHECDDDRDREYEPLVVRQNPANAKAAAEKLGLPEDEEVSA